MPTGSFQELGGGEEDGIVGKADIAAQYVKQYTGVSGRHHQPLVRVGGEVAAGAGGAESNVAGVA